MSGLLDPSSRLIVGVERDPDEPDLVRVYLDQRGAGRFVLASGDDAIRLEREWSDPARHLVTTIPHGTPIYRADPDSRSTE